ncbi:MAG: adenylate/guanylate cyclase domain-containing protein [Cyanobacteria bacterium P01_D01_bin.128]
MAQQSIQSAPRSAASGQPRRQASRVGHLLMGVWATLGGIAIAIDLPIAQTMEGIAQSFMLAMRGPVAPPSEVIILAIDEESLSQGEFYQSRPQEYPQLEPIQAWPFQRRAYALAIEQLLEAGAEAVAIDVLLVDPSSYGETDDAALAQTLERYGDRVVLASAYEFSSATGGALTQLLTPVYPETDFTPGLINVPVDGDTRIRQLPQRFIEDGLPETAPEAFSMAALIAAGISVEPPEGDGIFFYGPEDTFPMVPFWHVFEPENWALHLETNTFRDKVVLIGPTATSLQDFKRTPTSEVMPGVEVHANIAGTVLNERAIAPLIPNAPLRGGLITATVVGLGLILGRRFQRPLFRTLVFVGLIAGWGGIAYVTYIYGDRILPVAVPTVVMAFSGLSYQLTGAISDRLEQRRTRRTLERYVAASVVDEILNQPDDFRVLLVGKRLKAAVLFSDIRGFSRLSYQLKAEEMVQQLNTYLNAMVEAILRYRGTVDKFIGDAVMAEFGSPTSQGSYEDAMAAISAALAMRQALADLRAVQKAAGRPLFFHGIGISFGDVIAGNIGSVQRLEYTVIGDTVNVASRVEGLTKQLGTDILITQALYDQVREQVEVVDMGAHRLHGREQEAVQVYSLVGLKGQDRALYEQVQRSLQAHLNFYKSQQ